MTEDELAVMLNADDASLLANQNTLDALAALINQMIMEDFGRVVSLLYRVDVSEEKLKRLLRAHPDQDAGILIAGLLVERQLQKIKSRGEYTRRDNDIDDAEKW